MPVILESNLRFRLDSKLVRNFKSGSGKQPIIFTALENSKNSEWEENRRKFERENIKIISIPSVRGRQTLTLTCIIDTYVTYSN